MVFVVFFGKLNFDFWSFFRERIVGCVFWVCLL